MRTRLIFFSNMIFLFLTDSYKKNKAETL
jgi:hypothetical protein